MKILIVEDESRIAKRILRMVHEFFANQIEEVKQLESLQDALQYISRHQLDLVLLDLNLNGDSGFKLLKNTSSQAFHTIIISAYTDQALSAFEYGVLDFVAKPFNKERLNLAFNRAINKQNLEQKSIKVLGVKVRNEIQLINIHDIQYIKGAGIYSELVLNDGTTFLHDKSLEKLVQLLPDTFVRIHKSYLVKLTELQSIQVNSGSKYSVLLKNGEELPIGRARYKDLKAKYFG